jgi:hypothetical protein
MVNDWMIAALIRMLKLNNNGLTTATIHSRHDSRAGAIDKGSIIQRFDADGV